MAASMLDLIGEKLSRGRLLDREDALALWESQDLVSLGMLADGTRRQRHGDVTTFLRVADVALADAAGAVLPGTAGEVRVGAGAEDLAAGLGTLRDLVSRAGGTPVTVGSLEELEATAGSNAALRILLGRLKDTGVYGVAMAPVDALVSPEGSVRAVLEAGLAVARFTVQRAAGDPWPILDRVRHLQAATSAIRTFAPLARQHDPAEPTTGYADVKLVAVARLVLDGVSSIQVDWALHGPKLAQVSLLFGADDLDAVPTEEQTGTGRRRAPLEEVLRNVHAASLVPVQRDGRFGKVQS